MAQVSYFVMYKPINPNIGRPIQYTPDLYVPTDDVMVPGDTMSNLIAAAGSVTNPKNSMLFYYNGIGTKIMPSYGGGSGPASEFLYDKFEKFQGEVWVVHSIQSSLPAAMKVAEPLIMDIGAGNVKIFKSAEMDIQVVLSKK